MTLYKKSIGFYESKQIRKFETKDIVKRLGAISPNRVFINNHPIANPIAIFNSSAIARDSDVVETYARIIVGYYLYVSAIVRLEIPLTDILEGTININYYSSELVLYPSTKYDIWGCEDPRVYRINGEIFLTYAGRSTNYFMKPAAPESVLSITAVPRGNHRHWRKKYVHIFNGELRKQVIHDKNTLMIKIGDKTFLLHRPRLIDGKYYLLISEVRIPRDCNQEPCEAISYNSLEVIPPANFEEKLGWATILEIRGNRVTALIHSVDKDIGAYRILGLEFLLEKEGVVVSAVTPHYIMEPKTPYELYGDRPFTVFPCGAVIVDGDIIISYGAADYMVGFGLIDYAELKSALDDGRIY